MDKAIKQGIQLAYGENVCFMNNHGFYPVIKWVSGGLYRNE
jgi:hypothetical protein